MKKVLFILISLITANFSCNNRVSDKELQDSIAAERSADSMLRAATADTLGTDGTTVDSSAVDSVNQ